MNITAMNHLPKTEQLRALEAQREDARSRMTSLSDPVGGQEFSRLTTEIGSLAASFVLYQGQEVPATLVNYLSGNIPTSTVDHDGDEELFRDEQGRYYLRRVLNCLDAQGEARPASGRTLVHRIGINAAILWATTRLNSETLDLRCDAANLIMEDRGYNDTNPVHLNVTKRKEMAKAVAEPVYTEDGPVSSVTAPGWFEASIKPEDGSGARMRTTFDLSPFHANLLKAFTERHGINVAVLVRACLVDELEQLFNLEENGGEEEDEVLSCLRKYDRLTGYLREEEVEQITKDAALDPAGLAARKAGFGQGDTQEEEARQASPPLIEGSGSVEDEPGVHRFTFDYPATKQWSGLQRTVELTDEQMDRARELATNFGLDLPPFLRGLVHNNTLPGQPRGDGFDGKLMGLLRAEHIEFVCTDAAAARRIERAAQASSMSVDEFVAYSLGGDVDMWEENMLLHPTTGDLLDTDFEDLYTQGGVKITTPPIGREDEPQFKNSMGKERVNFGVYLRPDQLERLEYPHMVSDCETGQEVPCVLIPLDPEGSPHLSIGRRQVEVGEPISQPAERKEAA